MTCDVNTMHVMPVGDLVEHDNADGTPDVDCVCGPTTEPVPREDGSMGWIVVHHALDGRETGEKPCGKYAE